MEYESTRFESSCSASSSETTIIDRFDSVCRQHAEKNYTAAEAGYRELIVSFPGIWLLHYNLGLLLFETQRFAEALKTYEQACRLTSESIDLLFNLAICQKKLGRLELAGATYRQILAIEPDDVDSRYNLAGCYRELERSEEAMACYTEVLQRQPEHQQALNNLAYVLHKTGKKEQAAACYRNLLRLNPQHRAADHMLAALTGAQRRSVPTSYIKDVFDTYSDHYDDSLIHKLEYAVPEKLLRFIELTAKRPTCRTVLDLGCGTGLCGDMLRPLATILHGVDISEQMIELARKKAIYTELFTGEIQSFLSSCKAGYYELLVAADVLAYCGELRELFQLAHRACCPGGIFYFSIETLPVESSALQLQESGRFAHSDSYIRETAAAAGWSISAISQTGLRKERGQWVQGALYAACR